MSVDSIVLVPGFQAHIQIQDANPCILYQKDCPSGSELQAFIKKHGESKEGWSLLRGLVFPLRTNKEDIAKDFFLPTFVNFSLKINNVALRVFASIFAITIDAISFPLRFLLTPLRIYYNYRHPEEIHPIINLLKDHPKLKQVLANNSVQLSYNVKIVQVEDSTEVDEEGNVFQKAVEQTIRGTKLVALQRLPGGIENKVSETERMTFYLGMNGDWFVTSSVVSKSSHYTFAC